MMGQAGRRASRLGCGASLAVVVLCAFSAAAAAADAGRGGKVAVTTLTTSGNVPAAVKDVLRRRLADGLATARFRLVDADQGREIAECRDTACGKMVAARLGVDYLVAGRVTERQKTYDLELEIIDGRTGQVAGKSNARCEICGLEEVGERMALAASSLRARLEALVKEPALVTINTHPRSARVSIDGKPAGSTPLAAPLDEGEHRVLVEADGFVPVERTLQAIANVEQRLDIELARTPTSFPYRAAGWTAIGVGVAAVAAGIYALVLNGQEISCSEGERDVDGDCPFVHGTAALGAALIGGGAAVGSLGGIWLYLGASQAEPSEDATARAFRIGVRGRF